MGKGIKAEIEDETENNPMNKSPCILHTFPIDTQVHLLSFPLKTILFL